MKRIAWILLGAAVGLAAPSQAQDITFGGQIRPRYEFRDPTGDGTSDAFTSMRVRANLSARLDRQVRVFIQVQDVRFFGEEANTLTDFSADNFDLHQGYIELEAEIEQTLRFRVGREELNLGGQRLVGAVGWAQQGRAFDGARLTLGVGSSQVQLFGYRLQEATSATFDVNGHFLGAYGSVSAGDLGTLEPYALYNHTGGLAKTDQGTLGVRLHGQWSGTRYRVESSYQFGDRAGTDVAAFMFGARVGRSVGKGSLTLWYDYLSGDDDAADGETKVFDTLFATNHKFYGFADLFLNIPVATGGLGLQDAAVKASVQPHADVTASLDVHGFFTAQQGGLSTRHLGEELDLTLRYRYSAALTASAGVSYVIAADGMTELGLLTDDQTFLYLMLDARF